MEELADPPDPSPLFSPDLFSNLLIRFDILETFPADGLFKEELVILVLLALDELPLLLLGKKGGLLAPLIDVLSEAFLLMGDTMR